MKTLPMFRPHTPHRLRQVTLPSHGVQSAASPFSRRQDFEGAHILLSFVFMNPVLLRRMRAIGPAVCGQNAAAVQPTPLDEFGVAYADRYKDILEPIPRENTRSRLCSASSVRVRPASRSERLIIPISRRFKPRSTTGKRVNPVDAIR